MSANPIDPLTGMVPNMPGFKNPKAGQGFGDTLKKAVDDVEKLNQKAENSMEDLATGRRKTLHQTMIDVEKADIAFRLMVTVRDKAISAYQEIWRMSF